MTKFSSVSYHILSQQNRRTKRGHFDAGGSILKTLYGTWDSDDAEKFNDEINAVQSDENNLAHVMKDNIYVIKSTINTFDSTISRIKENEITINHNLNIIEKSFGQISYSNEKWEVKSKVLWWFCLLTSMTFFWVFYKTVLPHPVTFPSDDYKTNHMVPSDDYKTNHIVSPNLYKTNHMVPLDNFKINHMVYKQNRCSFSWFLQADRLLETSAPFSNSLPWQNKCSFSWRLQADRLLETSTFFSDSSLSVL